MWVNWGWGRHFWRENVYALQHDPRMGQWDWGCRKSAVVVSLVPGVTLREARKTSGPSLAISPVYSHINMWYNY